MISFYKRITVILVFIIAFFNATPAFADPVSNAEGSLHIYIDEKEIKFNVEPIIKDGTTLVQLRPAFEAMGLELTWNADDQTIVGRKGLFEVKLKIGHSGAWVMDDQEIQLAQPPEIINGSTMVPLRFVAEATGWSVYWVPSHDRKEIKINRSIASGILDTVFSGNLQYTGEQKDGKPHGKGTYSYKGQVWYDGEFVKGKMEGTGKLYEKEKLIYEGAFRGNLPNGKGRLLKFGIYEGDVKNGLRHGKGVLSYDGRKSYEGDFYEDTLTGKGTIYETNGDKYVGDVIMGVREGTAQVYDADGDLYYEGEYAGNHPVLTSNGMHALAVYLYAKQGKDQKVQREFDLLVKGSGDQAKAYKYLAQVYIELNQLPKATEALNTALALLPSDAELHVLAALVYALQNNAAKADEHSDKAISLGVDSDTLEAIMKQVESK